MSEAVFVQNAYKKFVASNLVQWKRLTGQTGIRSNAQIQEVVAVDHISFSIGQGEIFGLVGPGGSGKSTTIRLLAAMLLPDSGEIRIFGFNVARYPNQVQRLINRVSVDASFFRKLSPLENLLHAARLYGLSSVDVRQQVIELLTRLGLEETEIDQPMEVLSRVAQQLVAIAQALLCRPRLLLLDEPTAGLNLAVRDAVRNLLQELRDQHGTTILLAARHQTEIEMLCDRVAVMEAGKIVAVEKPARFVPLALSDEQETGFENVFLEAPVNNLRQECELS